MARRTSDTPSESTAPTVVVVGFLAVVTMGDGGQVTLYRGDVVPDNAAEESVDHLVSVGLVDRK